jgi:RNA recognition motif. (a.k.a. RRM, RBD, or RNP domain)
MSLPPPPGLKQPSSLPPRPPSTQSSSFKPAYSSAPSYSAPGAATGTSSYGAKQAPSTGYNSFTAFAPRTVASSQPYRTNSPTVSAPPQTTPAYQRPTAGYSNTYQNPQQSYQSGASSYYDQSAYGDSSYGASQAPQITNPFPLPGQERKGYGRESGMDPEMDAQIAQWQSAYMTRESDDPALAQAKPAGRPGAAPPASTASYSAPASNTPTPSAVNEPNSKTVMRSGGGQTWADSTLLEWDPAHFRLFVGNLAGEVTDDSLKKAFAKYTSVQKARVIRDKRTEKSKGYGFVSFSDGDDYFKAAREMQGKYIGSHPVLLRRAMTEVRPVSGDKKDKRGKKNGHGGGGKGPSSHGGAGGVGGGKPKGDGVKKQGYTRGGLKILG